MNPRYFIGISLPDNLTAEIQGIQTQMMLGRDNMDPLVPHITLLHPNILTTLSPMYFVPQVKVACKKFLPLNIELTKTALFDTRVLYISVKCPALIELHAALVDLLPNDIQARYQIGREYKPHVTLAQARPLQTLNPKIIDLFNKQIGSIIPTSFDVSNVTLFKSIGPRKYKIESI